MTASSSYYTLELISHSLPRRTIRSDGVFVIIIHTYNNIYCDSIAYFIHLSSRPDQGNLHELTQSTLPFSNEIGAAVWD